MRQPPRHLFGSRKDERVGAGSRRFDGAEGSVVEPDELAELSEVGAHEREVMFVVQRPDPADALPAGWLPTLQPSA